VFLEEAFQRRFFERLLQSQYLPAEDIVFRQREVLAPLLRHAHAHTRFYRTRLDVLFRTDGSIDWDRWVDIPVVTRSDVLADPDAFYPDRPSPEDGPTGDIKTSGSTGKRMVVRYNQRTALATRAVKWRADLWHHVDWSRTLYVRRGEHPDQAEWPKGERLGPWGPPWDERARRGAAFRLHKQVQNDQQIEFIRRIGAAYLAPAGPKMAQALALEVERQGLNLRLNGIFTSGEQVDSLDQAACRRVFGTEIVDVYSSKEGNHMAHRCPEHPWYHVNAETVLLEILDSNGNPCRPGEIGRVVVTPLYSTAQPLIRYDHQDLATLGEQCSCGRTLPVLSSFLGRVAHLFRHPDGRVLKRNLPDEYREILQAGPWQIAQVGPNDYQLRYVPLDWNRVGDEASVQQAFKRIFFADASLTFKRVGAIAPIASGKYIEYVNEYNPPS